MNLKTILVIVTLVFSKYTVFSQVDATVKKSFWKNVRYGGNISLGFSNRSTNIGIAPSAIYQFNDKLSAGFSVSFGYSSFERNDVKQFNYGASTLMLYNPIQMLQLSLELEQTFVNSSFKINGVKFNEDFNFPALYIGAGYRLGNLSTGLRYDLLYRESRSIYASALGPFVRIYF